MREINECTAEVFRRSEKKIKKRKQSRNRALLCCVPMLICIAVLSVTVMPTMKQAEGGIINEAGDNSALGEHTGSNAYFFCSVEINDCTTGGCRIITDKQDVDRMYIAVLNIYDTVSGDCESGGDISTPRFEFIFKTEEGTTFSYRLTGNVMFCAETGRTVYLSGEQLENLTEVFELNN